MKVIDLIQNLSYGELSNLAIGVGGTGTIPEDKWPMVLLHANEGLLRLHTKFTLKEKDLLIELVEHITNYHLDSKFAESNWVPAEQPYPYIKDLIAEPFTNDVIRILSVYNNWGQQLPLNDPTNVNSVFTPQAKIIQVPHPVNGMSLNVVYQASHPKLTVSDLEKEIDLPDTLVSALTAYIGFKVFGNMVTPEALQKSQELLSQYNAVCDEALMTDVVSVSFTNTPTFFEDRGWI